MARALNWDKARRERDARRAKRFHKRKPAPRHPLPPTPAQVRYIARLAEHLDRKPPPIATRAGASALIEQLKHNLATARRK